MKSIDMRFFFFALFYFFINSVQAQADSISWHRGFPITSYMVQLNDSITVVQVELPEYMQLKAGQAGLIKGIYRNETADTATKGYGLCHLIKGNYYYFSIGHNESGSSLKEADLLYCSVGTPAVYTGKIVRLASHFIRLMDVMDSAFYDRYLVFLSWTQEQESMLLDTMKKDVRYTGKYFEENNPEMNADISQGSYKGKKLFDVMKSCTKKDLEEFFGYMLARPRLYAGNVWKLSEIFATWVVSGAPSVLRD